MPLESLDNQINIHDLTLEQEKKPESESQKLYESLKTTPFYDAEKEQWNEFIDKNQVLRSSKRGTEAQLFGVLAEAIFDKDNAQKLYEKLKKTRLYSQEDWQWNRSIDKDQFLNNRYRDTNAQLVGIITEALFDKDSAKIHYDNLKKTVLYDAKEQQWCESLEENQSLGSDSRNAFNQLFGVLAEAIFDKNNAQKLYEKIKKTNLYNKENEQWNMRIIKDRSVVDVVFDVGTQLAGILAENTFNKNNARRLYEKLKKTTAYDPENKQWDLKTNNEFSSRWSRTQLLGVLCEAELEQYQPDLQTPTPQLPETRKY